MTEPFNERPLTKDERDFIDHIGVGEAHRPPPKKFKPDNREEKKEPEAPEPKSMDVFDTPDSLESPTDTLVIGEQLQVEEARADSPEAGSKDIFMSDDDEEVMTEESMVVDSQESEDSLQKTTPKRVRQLSEVSVELGEDSFMTNIDATLTPGMKKWRGDERRAMRDKLKGGVEKEEEKDETMTHQDMETGSDYGSPTRKTIGSPSNDDYTTAAESLSLKSEVFKTPTSSRHRGMSDEGSEQNTPVTRSAERLSHLGIRQDFEKTPRGIEPRTPTSNEKEKPKSPATTSSMSDTSTANKIMGMRNYLEILLTSFHREQLVFHPHLDEVDTQSHVVYVDIPGVERKEPNYDPSKMIEQYWRPYDLKGDENPNYHSCRQLMENYLIDYKEGGYWQFQGLLGDLHDNKDRCPALEAWYIYESERLQSEEEVFEQFANIVRLALRAEEILPVCIYKLGGPIKSGTFSQEQCAAFLSWLFFIDDGFLNIFQMDCPLTVEKCKFIFTYFNKVCREMPDGNITFRLVSKRLLKENIASNTDYDYNVRLSGTSAIEDVALCTQVDFANKFLGGGVLRRGMVQEEIRFMMCPEMIVGMFLTSKMENHQAISIIGAQVYSSYSGYSHRTLWQPLQEKSAMTNNLTWRDKFKRLRWECIAIDALAYKIRGYDDSEMLKCQLTSTSLDREILKAYVGFSAQQGFNSIPIWSGWWGCGAFNGNKPLKFIIQVIAAKLANRPLVVCAFGDTENMTRCRTFMEIIQKKRISVGELYRLLKSTFNMCPTRAPEDYVMKKIQESIAQRQVYSDVTSMTPFKRI